MTRTRLLAAAGALVVPLLFAPASARSQDVPPVGVWQTAYDEAPRLLNAKELRETLQANYPAELRESDISGSVVLWILVDDTGAVTETMVHRRSEYAAFDRAAQEVARAMKFRPAQVDDEPVGTWILQRVDFNTR